MSNAPALRPLTSDATPCRLRCVQHVEIQIINVTNITRGHWIINNKIVSFKYISIYDRICAYKIVLST